VFAGIFQFLVQQSILKEMIEKMLENHDSKEQLRIVIENLQESIIYFRGGKIKDVNKMFIHDFGLMIHSHYEDLTLIQ
jgi:hypothetical protein